MLNLLLDETRWFSKDEGFLVRRVRLPMGVWAPEPEGLVAHPVSLSPFFHAQLALAIKSVLYLLTA
jgi:hypothetical protein